MSALLPMLPGLNAILIAISGVAILTGVVFIKRGQRDAHKWAMITATAAAAVFLVFYYIRLSRSGTNAFNGPPGARRLYFYILVSHIGLALVSMPMVITVLWRAYKQKWVLHKRLARWTYPIWLYVSCTGVLVWLFLYKLYP